MKKARFSVVRAANMAKSSISYLTSNHDGTVTLTNAHDRTILVNIELCLKYLSDFRESGKAATDHQWVKIINSDEPEKHMKLEVTHSARLFIKVFQLLVPLKQYSEYYKFHPLIETAVALKDEYYDVLSVIQSADSHDFIDVFKFINISDFNAAVSTLLGRINVPEHRTHEFNYYRPVFIVIKRKEEKARKIIEDCKHTPYIAVINLLFSHEKKYSESSLQKHSVKFGDLSGAVDDFIEKAKRRKKMPFIKGLLVKLQYTKQNSWHAHAAFILDIPEPRINDALIKRVVKALVRVKTGKLIKGVNKSDEQEKIDELIGALCKGCDQEKIDRVIEKLTKAVGKKTEYTQRDCLIKTIGQETFDILIEVVQQETAEDLIESVMGIWSSNNDVGALKDKESHLSIYAHATVHHPAKSVEKNSLSKIPFFCLNTILPSNGCRLIYPGVKSVQPLVDFFDCIFLPQCLMKYKESDGENKIKMIRSYRW
ncbi:hypothetical protein ACEUCF_13220 [Aeromonas veronii]